MRSWIFVTLMAVLGASALTAQAARIAFNDTAGAIRTYKTDIKVTGTMSAMGINAPIDAVVNQTMVEKVTDVQDGKATVNTSQKEGSVEVKISGLPDENGETKAQTIKQDLPAMSIDFTRTAQGKVSDVKMDGDVTKMFGGADGGALNMTQFPGQGIEFPAGDVKVGDTWSGKESMKLSGDSTLDVAIKYTLTGTKVVDGKTYLVITADIDTNVPKLKTKTGAGAAATDMTLSFTLKGQAITLFDEKAGEIFKEYFDLASTMNMTGGDNAAKMDMVIKGTMQKTK